MRIAQGPTGFAFPKTCQREFWPQGILCGNALVELIHVFLERLCCFSKYVNNRTMVCPQVYAALSHVQFLVLPMFTGAVFFPKFLPLPSLFVRLPFMNQLSIQLALVVERLLCFQFDYLDILARQYIRQTAKKQEGVWSFTISCNALIIDRDQ